MEGNNVLFIFDFQSISEFKRWTDSLNRRRAVLLQTRAVLKDLSPQCALTCKDGHGLGYGSVQPFKAQRTKLWLLYHQLALLLAE